MRHPISVQPQSTYQSSNHQLRIFIVFIRRHIGAYHGPNLIFHPVTVTCNITCASFEVMCSCRVVLLWGILGRSRDKRNKQSAKLGPKQLGPFEVTEVLSDVDYRLALPPALRLHDVFHVDRLSPYKGNDVNGLIPPPPDPVTITA